MNVEELKAKLPEARVYKLVPGAKYLFVLDINQISMLQTVELANVLKELDIDGGIILLDDPEKGIRILEMKED